MRRSRTPQRKRSRSSRSCRRSHRVPAAASRSQRLCEREAASEQSWTRGQAMKGPQRLPGLSALLCVLALSSVEVRAQSSFLDKSQTDWLKQLASREARDRRSAAFALGKIGPAAGAAVPRLVDALTDADPTVA